jgi:hypothetical protein
MVEQVKQSSRDPWRSFRAGFFARWTPNWLDLLVVGLSWILVVAALRTATTVVTAERGLLYFLVYAIVGATVIGLGMPLMWMVLVRRRPIADLGLTTRRWPVSLAIQAVLAAVLYFSAYRGDVVDVPPRTSIRRSSHKVLSANFAESPKGEVRRILLLRGLVNKTALGRSLVSLGLVLLYVLQEVPRSEHGQPREIKRV